MCFWHEDDLDDQGRLFFNSTGGGEPAAAQQAAHTETSKPLTLREVCPTGHPGHPYASLAVLFARAVERAREEAGLPVAPHVLRHSWG
jgi:hypothetical protein